MPQYTFRAVGADGRMQRGKVQTTSRQAAMRLLLQRGTYPVQLLEARILKRRLRIPPADLSAGLATLAGILQSGLPLMRAFTALDALASSSWKAALPTMREHVREGGTFAGSLEAAGVPLPAGVVGMIRAGEAGGELGAAVQRAAEVLEGSANARRSMRASLTYPLVLAAAGSGSLALLIGVVLPRFERVLADMGQALPTTLNLILDMAAAVRAGFIPGLLCIAAAVAAWRVLVQRPQGMEQWHGALLRVPGVGPVRHAAATARALEVLAALLRSGVPLTSALQYAAAASGDAAVAGRVMAARRELVAGNTLFDALRLTAAFTPGATFLMAAGAESGDVAKMAEYAARLESDRSQRAVQNIVRLMEPLLILGFACVVAIVAAALMQGIYSVRPTT
jgi:general secretion pathway protein F